MNLQEFEKSGGCEVCYFYCEVEPGTKKCTFRWFDDDSSDWEFSKNCDSMEECLP